MRGMALGFALTLLAAQAAANDATGVPAPRSVAIVGAVTNPDTVTDVDLAQMKPIDVTVNQQTDKGPVQGTWRGVLLWTLIDKAGLANGPEKNAYLRHTIVVSGADGYAAAFGEGELDPRLEGKQVILAFMKDGAMLDGMQLVVPGDAHASRGVHDVISIEVK